MSIFYATSNKESTRDLYEKRTIYNVAAKNNTGEKYTNLVDFNFAEKFLYGRVDRYFIPIIHKARGLVVLKGFRGQTATLRALNFVVDAFEGLSMEFKRCASNGQISSDDPFLSNLIVAKAYEDPAYLYNNYLTTYYGRIVAQFKKNNIQVKNFKEFLTEVEMMLERGAPRFPFTQTGYVKSRLCPITCSGLAIEIGSLDCANDEEKMNQFIKSRNWEFYVNACRSYGFMVDKFVPWRIVADIGASPTIEYAAKYGAKTTNSILTGAYTPVPAVYYAQFKFVLLNLYNRVKVKSFLEFNERSGTLTSTLVTPQSYSKAQLAALYADSYFLKLYLKIRLWEEESSFKDFEEEMLIDDTIELYMKKGAVISLTAFERVLNKTFDYQGSLSYNRKYLDAIAAEAT